MKLGKFAASIERITVRLSDANGPKGGRDQVCQIKVVISGLPSVVVEERDAAFQQSFRSPCSVRRAKPAASALKPLHHRASQPPVTGLDDRGRSAQEAALKPLHPFATRSRRTSGPHAGRSRGLTS